MIENVIGSNYRARVKGEGFKIMIDERLGNPFPFLQATLSIAGNESILSILENESVLSVYENETILSIKE